MQRTLLTPPALTPLALAPLALAPLALALSLTLGCSDGSRSGGGGDTADCTLSDGATLADGQTADANGETCTCDSGTLDCVPAAEPLDAPAGQWTWIELEDTRCANGEPTGLAINPGTSKDVLFFMEGGGACWSYDTCYASPVATYIDTGFRSPQYELIKHELEWGPLDKSDADNPFKDMSMVWVPYCTGDVHSGDNVVAYDGIETHHVGRKNLDAYVARLRATFPDPDKVVVAGFSAGGFGSLLNWERFEKAYPESQLYVISDGGPLIPQPFVSPAVESLLRGAFNLDPLIPSACSACADGLANLHTYLAQTYPDTRGALVTLSNDYVIEGYLQTNRQDFFDGIVALEEMFEPHPNMNAFVPHGDDHVLLFDWWNQVVEGITLQQWVAQMVNDDPAWTSLRDPAAVSPF